MMDRPVIYLVDDDDDDRMFTKEAFGNFSKEIEIFEYINGQLLLEALDQAKNTRLPSLILMDVNMPRFSGVEVLSVIRSNPEICHIPVILFSTSSSPGLIREAYQLGVNAYIVKPSVLGGYMQMARAVMLCFLNAAGLPENIAGNDSFKDKSILVIEDNSDHWNLMRLTMKAINHVNLIHRDSAESAMAFLLSANKGFCPPVELIVLDLYLPDRQQGLDLIADIRNLFTIQKLPPVPILIFSSSDHQDDIKASYQRKANAYITKSTDLARSVFHLNDVCSLWSTTIVMPGVTNNN